MTDPTATPKSRCVPCPVGLALGVLLLALAVSWVSSVVEQVFAGNGLEHCCTIEGVSFNYIAVFVLLCAAAAALLLAIVLNVRDWLIRRDFERKYGVKLPATMERSVVSDSYSGPSLHGAEYGDGD